MATKAMTNPTLLQAAQAIRALREWVQAVPQDTVLPTMPGIDGDWLDDVEENLIKAIKAIKREKAQPSKFDVLVITTAYEQGFGKGLQNLGIFNPYAADSAAFKAWQIGYGEGSLLLEAEPKSQYGSTEMQDMILAKLKEPKP